MVGASHFHLLGVGAEKSSLYRLGFMKPSPFFIKGEERLSPFAGLLVRSPAL